MSEDPRDPSPRSGRRPIADAERLRAILRDRLARSRYAGVDCAWGFVLTGVEGSSGAAGSYGYVAAVTPTDAIALTPTLVRATTGRTLYMLGCMRSSLTVPDTCVEMDWQDHTWLPAVALRATLGCARGMLGGGHLEATVEYDQAARTPLTFLTIDPIPGWPR